MYLIFKLWGLYFVHFHSLVNYGIIFWGNTSSMYKVFLTQKRYCELCWSSCKKWLKKLESLHIPSLYIYSLMLFVVDNLHYFQTNSCVHKINTRHKNHLHIPSVRPAAIQRGTTYSAVRYSTNYPLESQDLKMIRQFSSLL